MARPIKSNKNYSDDDKRIATFSISHGLLTAFQDVCEQNGVSFSHALNKHISEAVKANALPDNSSIPKNIVTQEDLESELYPLKMRLKTLESTIDQLEKRTRKPNCFDEVDNDSAPNLRPAPSPRPATTGPVLIKD